MQENRRAYSCLEVKGVNEDRRIIRGIATTPGTDRVGDIIEPLGVKFKNPLAFLWQHNHAQPIGTVRFEKPTEDGIWFEAEIPIISEAGSLKDRVDEAWQSIKLGLVRAVSIGFRAIEYNFMDNGGIRFSKTEVFELSAVTIPANAEAVITGIGKSMNAATIAALKQFDITATAANGKKTADISPGASGIRKNKINLKPKEKTMARKIGERIEALENTRMEKAEQMEAILQKSDEEGRTTDAAEQEEFDSLNDELRAIDADLERYRALERTRAAEAKPVNSVKENNTAGTGMRTPVTVKNELKKGILFARYTKSLASANGNPMLAMEIAKERYPDQKCIQNVLKAAISAGSTTDMEWAGALVDYQLMVNDFIEFLRPTTILGKFGTDNIPALFNVPFNIKVPAQTSGGDAYWVGQGKPKPLTKFDFSQIKLGFTKVATIAVLTEELVRFSKPSADELVRDALAKTVRQRLDIDFVDPKKAAVADVSPASITNGVTPITSTGDPDKDFDKLYKAFIVANLSTSNAVFLMSEILAQQLARRKNPLGQREYPEIGPRGGILDGLPVITSQSVPAGIIILAAADEIYLADDGQVVIDASREASLEMASDPNNDGSVPTHAELVSMFQTNCVAIKAERFINWQKRRKQAVAYIEGADYSKDSGS